MTSSPTRLSPSTDLSLALAASYPPLGRYCPNLPTISLPQAKFLLLDCREAFYGGAAGGGKSDALLMAALQYVDVPGYAALLLRRTFPELQGADGLLARSREWLANTDASWNEQQRTWTFPSGATLRFGHMESEADMHRYDGQAYQFVGFDEVTTFTESQYEWVGFTRARRRKAHELAGVPIRTRASGMPAGPGVTWVKRRFVTGRAASVAYVPARVHDNPGLDVEGYAASLGELPRALKLALLEGDWDVTLGAAYPEFTSELHVAAPNVAPATWDRFEHMDFGVANPTAWHLSTVDYDGNLIVLDEYYAAGLVSEHAAEVKRRRNNGWQPKDEHGWPLRTNPVYGDPSIRARTGGQTQLGDPASVLTEFAEHEIAITGANNDRRAGHLRIRELLRPDPERRFPQWHPRYGETGAPRLYVAPACTRLIEQLRAAPLLPLDSGLTDAGEIVDPRWESRYGHAHASLRYGVMSRPGPSSEPTPEPEDPREAALQRLLSRRRDPARARGDDYADDDLYLEL